MEPMPPWFDLAHRQLGTMEIPGLEDNPRIVEYHKYTVLDATDDEVPWCSAFVCAMLERSGVMSTNSAAAISYEGYGVALNSPRLGCIVTMKRGGKSWQRHVTFFAGETEDYFIGLGGNQGNAVDLTMYKKDKVTAYRWPGKFKYQSLGG